jgi:predicted nucleic acid-binding Zn finger protein
MKIYYFIIKNLTEILFNRLCSCSDLLTLNFKVRISCKENNQIENVKEIKIQEKMYLIK